MNELTGLLWVEVVKESPIVGKVPAGARQARARERLRLIASAASGRRTQEVPNFYQTAVVRGPNMFVTVKRHQMVQNAGRRRLGASPVTQAGFVRLSANARVVSDPVRPVDSLDLLGQLRTVGAHTFWVDDLDIVSSELFAAERLTGHRQVTDAHPLALSRRWNGSLATFDRGISLLASGRDGTTVELIE